jgi:hypothetical protein
MTENNKPQNNLRMGSVLRFLLVSLTCGRFLPVCQNRNFAVDVVIAFGTVGHQAVGAIFDAVFGIAAVSTAVVPQNVQRTVAEQAIKIAVVLCLVAGEIPAIFVLKNDVNFPCFYLNS